MNVAGKYKLISFENRNKNGFDFDRQGKPFWSANYNRRFFLKSTLCFAGHKKIGTPVQPFWFYCSLDV